MDNWDATVIRLLSTQRHAEEIARGLAAQRCAVSARMRTTTSGRRLARRAAIVLLAGVLALGCSGSAAADPAARKETPIRGDFCYTSPTGDPAPIFPRCLPRPLPVPPGQVAI